jgi:predicted small secreted protein
MRKVVHLSSVIAAVLVASTVSAFAACNTGKGQFCLTKVQYYDQQNRSYPESQRDTYGRDYDQRAYQQQDYRQRDYQQQRQEYERRLREYKQQRQAYDRRYHSGSQQYYPDSSSRAYSDQYGRGYDSNAYGQQTYNPSPDYPNRRASPYPYYQDGN